MHHWNLPLLACVAAFRARCVEHCASSHGAGLPLTCSDPVIQQRLQQQLAPLRTVARLSSTTAVQPSLLSDNDGVVCTCISVVEVALACLVHREERSLISRTLRWFPLLRY